VRDSNGLTTLKWAR